MKPILFIYSNDEENIVSLGRLGLLINILVPIKISKESLDEIVDSCMRIAILEFEQFENWLAQILLILRDYIPEVYVISREKIHAEGVKWIKLVSDSQAENDQLKAIIIDNEKHAEIFGSENLFAVLKRLDLEKIQKFSQNTFAIAIPFDELFEHDKVLVVDKDRIYTLTLSEYMEKFSQRKDEFILVDELEIGLLLERAEKFYLKAQSEEEEDRIEAGVGFSLLELAKLFRLS